MKQYTNSEQTAKLIELGLPRPRCLHDGVLSYNIGELIEMLPSALTHNNDEECEFHLMLFDDSLYWYVRYTDGDNFCYPSQAIELIDALYAMIVLLKEEGVI